MSGIFNAIYATWNQIVYAISNFRWLDILDILVIAFIIYKAIGFLLETKAGRLVKGIVILFVIYVLATGLELATLQWLLTKVMGSAIIAVVVIFQPELRRILETVGNTKFSHNRFFDNDDTAVAESIDKIGKAVGFMSEKKIGALIVFERRNQLGEIVNTGTVLDAVASVSFVNNIFFPKSPLHDGALIVREGRLLAAGCILPLTQSENVHSDLGTRHRAAIGMSENSDAVVLVVSEETGIISIAVDGKITRNYNSVTAIAELQRLLLTEDGNKATSNIVTVIKNINPFAKNKERKDD
ncbi:MAG: diadenylate cyclase CdaA [Clostridia bacterium]|nr:diadenylate cyclase CdaA [Clostridia bacterium]